MTLSFLLSPHFEKAAVAIPSLKIYNSVDDIAAVVAGRNAILRHDALDLGGLFGSHDEIEHSRRIFSVYDCTDSEVRGLLVV